MSRKTRRLELFLAAMLSLLNVAAASAEVTQYGEYQRKEWRNMALKKTEAHESKVNWTERDGTRGLHMVTEYQPCKAALIYDLPAKVQAKQISFYFEKFKRGHVLTDTTEPIVRLEYWTKAGPQFWLIRPESMELQDDPAKHRTFAKFHLHQVEGKDPWISRIAIIATCKVRKLVVLDYGDMDVWGLQVNQKPLAFTSQLEPKKDGGADKLIEDVEP